MADKEGDRVHWGMVKENLDKLSLPSMVPKLEHRRFMLFQTLEFKQLYP